MFPASVITVSDSCSAGSRQDLSGPAVAAELSAAGFSVTRLLLVPDEIPAIQDALAVAFQHSRLVVTTGGTGVAPRDLTPEASRPLCDRLLDGVAEVMRAAGRTETPLAALSRGICGTAGRAILLNVPGSPRGAVTSVRAVLPLLTHALRLLDGETQHHDPAESTEP